MRIIGEIAHPKYKITVLHMNAKVTLQIEDGLLEQSFVFREGSGIDNAADAERLLTDSFLTKVDARFKDMQLDYIKALEGMQKPDFERFKII